MIDEIKNLEMMSATLVPLLVMLHRMALAQFAPLEPSQYIALMNVYDGLGCTNATICPRFNMSSICEGSLTCTVDDVTALDFRNVGLTGTISTMIAQLTSLRYLHLENNELRGNIPSTLWQLTRLQELSLANNRFIGTFPPVLAPDDLSLGSCWLQREGDSSCLVSLRGHWALCDNANDRFSTQECSNTPLNCFCEATECSPPPPSTTRKQRSSSTSTSRTTTSSSNMNSVLPSMLSTTSANPSATTTESNSLATANAEMTTLAATQGPVDNPNSNPILVGTIVGIVIGLLSLGLLIACVVVLVRRRDRRRQQQQRDTDANAMQLNRQSNSSSKNDNRSEYGVLITSPTNAYDQIEITPKENNYTKGALEL